MLTVEKTAMDMARERAAALLDAYKEAAENGTDEERRMAWLAYREANGAWMTMLRNGYRL